MAIESNKREFTETDLDVIRRTQAGHIWPPQSSTAGPIPAGQNVAVVLLAISDAVGVAEHDALCAAIEQIAGVSKALVEVHGHMPDADKVPDGYHLTLRTTAAIGFRKDPEP